MLIHSRDVKLTKKICSYQLGTWVFYLIRDLSHLSISLWSVFQLIFCLTSQARPVLYTNAGLIALPFGRYVFSYFVLGISYIIKLQVDRVLIPRGLFIIDNKGILRQITVNDLPVGRSVDETLRLVQAFQFTDKHGEGTIQIYP